MKCLGSIGILWLYWFVFRTGMLWAVPRYQYAVGSTNTAHSIMVLPRAYRSQKQIGTAQSILVLPREYRYCLEYIGIAQSVSYTTH